MKDDMKHIVIDRPRGGGRGGNSDEPKGWNRRRQKMGDDLPIFESSARKRRYGYDCKHLNDNLSPLKRWLRTQVGRQWDDVHSEICENLRQDSVSQSHVRDHIKHMVVTEIQMIDGDICDSRGDSLGFPGRYYNCFYVDLTGILREIQYKRYHRKKQKYNWIPGKDKDHQYHCINGVWYEVELKPYPTTASTLYNLDGYRDVVLDKHTVCTGYSDRKRMSLEECARVYGRKVYAFKKRQLNSKEIKKLNKDHPEALEMRENAA